MPRYPDAAVKTPPAAVDAPQPILQPFTFRGVALYATNPFRRLFVAQLLVGIFGSIISAWLVGTHISPVVTEAIEKLPEKSAGLHSGILAGITTPIVSGQKFFSLA